MAAQRLDDPGSKLGCATRWLPDIAWLPEAGLLAVDQLYRALDFLAVWSDAIERDAFLRSADLLRLDVDLIFYDTTTAYFEIDEPDEHGERWGGRLFAPLRQRGHNKERRDNQPQVIIAMAVTRDGMPVRSWVLPGEAGQGSAGAAGGIARRGNTADVATVARIKQDLHAWRLGRCLFGGDAGMYSADNLIELSRGLGRYVLAVPMRRVKDVESEVLTRPGRYRKVADNLEVKEVWVGDGERRKRYVLCFNPAEAEQQRAHRAQVLVKLAAELTLLDERQEDHPKAACALMASRRYGRYLTTNYTGRPRLDAAKVKAAERFDGKWVVITNDETLTAEDVALAYKGGAIIESCFRRMKQTGLEVRPMFHWAPRRIEAHVKLCVLALQVQRTAEIRTGVSWARIAHLLGTLKAVRYVAERQSIVQRTKITSELAELLKKLGIPIPKQLLAVTEAPETPATA
ncbi:MAG TPA: transposase, partial [Chloroflexota bacterium]|nr:transposase [Chloroflexota bacterium]